MKDGDPRHVNKCCGVYRYIDDFEARSFVPEQRINRMAGGTIYRIGLRFHPLLHIENGHHPARRYRVTQRVGNTCPTRRGDLPIYLWSDTP